MLDKGGSLTSPLCYLAGIEGPAERLVASRLRRAHLVAFAAILAPREDRKEPPGFFATGGFTAGGGLFVHFLEPDNEKTLTE